MSEAHGDGELPDVRPPQTVTQRINRQGWEHISFLHWRYDREVVQALLPDGLEVHTFDGAAWIGVTPFRMRFEVLPGRVLSRFPETNVRTYVRGADGTVGLHFLHMEVGAAWFVGLRGVGLPYVRRRMTIECPYRTVAYRSYTDDLRPGGHYVVVRIGALLDPPTGDSLERFLTARWTAFHTTGPLLLATPVSHPPWSLRTAAVEHWEVDGLFAAAGLPAPTHEPLVHYSTGVNVDIGWPRRISRSRTPHTLGSQGDWVAPGTQGTNDV